ncbi:MAG: hypothetical protein IJ223_01315 [Clostridia bacterium]|nr:hypothetical protein [Clostridia bacterium]
MKNFFKATIFFIILILLIIVLSKVMNPSGGVKMWYSSNSILDFYEQTKDTIDVIYTGNSCIYSAVSPLEIYENTGITGYNLSTGGQKIWSSYYLIKEAFRLQKPKLIFVEVGELFSYADVEQEREKRYVIDSMEFSLNKMEMINDNIYNFSFEDKLGCVFPLFRYHTRWSNLDETDFRKIISKEEIMYKGYDLVKIVKKYTGKRQEHGNKARAQLSADAEKYASKIVELCKEKNCKLVFIKIPDPNVWTEEKHNAVVDLTSRLGVEYIDLSYDNLAGINWETDTQDVGDHLNIAGAEKISNYISDYLVNNTDFEDHRQDSKYTSWNMDLETYNLKKQQQN